MSKITPKELLEVGAHFGHKTKKWDPRMKPYLYGVKNDIHIFDLEKTAEAFNRAIAFMQKLIKENKTILFVSTKQQTFASLPLAAKKCNQPFVAQKWFAGLLTNFETIKKRIKYMKDLKAQEESGELQKYTKKEQSDFEKEITKLEAALGGVANLTRLPDAIFVPSAVRDQIVIKEAQKLNIPIIAIIDSDGNPDKIDFVIPANDDSVKALNFYLEKIAEALTQDSEA